MAQCDRFENSLFVGLETTCHIGKFASDFVVLNRRLYPREAIRKGLDNYVRKPRKQMEDCRADAHERFSD